MAADQVLTKNQKYLPFLFSKNFHQIIKMAGTFEKSMLYSNTIFLKPNHPKIYSSVITMDHAKNSLKIYPLESIRTQPDLPEYPYLKPNYLMADLAGIALENITSAFVCRGTSYTDLSTHLLKELEELTSDKDITLLMRAYINIAKEHPLLLADRVKHMDEFMCHGGCFWLAQYVGA